LILQFQSVANDNGFYYMILHKNRNHAWLCCWKPY